MSLLERLFLRRQPVAQPALHLPTPTFLPSAIVRTIYTPGQSASVRSLLDSLNTVPEVVTSVTLDDAGNSSPVSSYVVPDSGGSSSTAPDRDRVKGNPVERHLLDRLRRVLSPPVDALLPGPGSLLKWPHELMPFQLEGVRTLIASSRLLLADDMGLGKTVQVIAALRVLMIKRAIGTALVVAPASILDQWRQELLRWAPELTAMIIRGSPVDRAWQWSSDVHVAIVSFETLRSDFTDNLQSPLRRKTWDVLIADEAQRIKNRNPTSSAVKALQRRRSWALSGTPLENNEGELASIVEFVDQGQLTSEARYSPGIMLRERHHELQLRRRKGDVLKDLPPKLTTKLEISLSPKQRRSYDRAERDGIVHLRELGADVRIQHVLELISRLKQICNAEPETGQSSKFENIRQRIDSLAGQGHRAIVFSQYTSMEFGVGALSETLAEFEPLAFTGAMEIEERRDVIRRFRSDNRHKALIVSLRAGGVGLNLQDASYVFHADRWWNPAVERQAEDRSHRYGQALPVHVFKYSCINTIEERIDRILEQKQELFDELVDDVSLDLASALSADQLFGLFGLENPVAG